MRADRLVAALLVLQARGRITAAQLAAELETSERTARRDLEALAMAGIPVYSQPGRGGGWSLVGGARTDLSGLNAAEVRTLFLVVGPSSRATPALKAALRKLVRAIPEPLRADAEAASAAVLVDPDGWDRTRVPPPPHLEVLERAVVDGLQVRLGYAGRDRAESERVVHPLGLVAKGRVWYLIAGTEAGQRTFRLDRVRSVTRTTDPVLRPDGFDLGVAWRATLASLDEQRLPCRAVVRADRDVLRWLHAEFGTRLVAPDAVEGDAVVVELRGHSAGSLAVQLARFGDRVEVLEPDEVRVELARLGRVLTERYAPTR